MFNSNKYLAKCQQLAELGLQLQVKPGQRIGRGFADLGFEEFYLLPNQEVLAIYTGSKSQWNEQQAGHFFLVPDEKQLLRILLEQKITFTRLELCVNSWEAELSLNEQDLTYQNTDASLQELLINILLWVLKNQ